MEAVCFVFSEPRGAGQVFVVWTVDSAGHRGELNGRREFSSEIKYLHSDNDIPAQLCIITTTQLMGADHLENRY